MLVMMVTEQMEALTALRGHTSLVNQNLLQTQKEGNGFLRHMDESDTLLHPSCYFSVLANPLLWKWWQYTVLVPFSPFLFISRLKLKSAGSMRMNQDVRQSSGVSFVQRFHCSAKKETHIHVWATKQEVCNSYFLRCVKLTFVIKTGIAHDKGE